MRSNKLESVEIVQMPASTKELHVRLHTLLQLARGRGYRAVSVSHISEKLGIKQGGNLMTALRLFCYMNAYSIISIKISGKSRFYALTKNPASVRNERDVQL